MNVNPRIFQALALASGLTLYAKTGIRPNTRWTPSAMMYQAQLITGRVFKPRAYMVAAEALRDWAATAVEEKLPCA